MAEANLYKKFLSKLQSQISKSKLESCTRITHENMSYKLCRALVPKEENSRFHEILVKIKGIGENRLHFIGPGLDLSVYELTLNEEELSIMKLSLHKAKFIWLMD